MQITNKPSVVPRSNPRPPGQQTVMGLILTPFSIFQNLELSISSIKDKCHFAISSAGSSQYQFLYKSLSKYSNPYMSYGLFSRFQHLQLVIASTNDKYHLAISTARPCQYQPSASVDFLGSCILHFSFTFTDIFF